MGIFRDFHPVGKDLLSQAVQQEAGLAVLGMAAQGAGEAAQQVGCNVGAEDHRRLAGAQLAAIELGHGIGGSLPADSFGRQQFAPVPSAVIPVVPLHTVAILGQHHAAEGMAAGGIAAHETVAVAVNETAALRIQGGAFGIADTFVVIAGSLFGFQGQVMGLVRVDIPGMMQIQFRIVPGQQLRVGQAGARVFGSVTGDGAGLAHGFSQGSGLEVRGVRRPLAFAEIHADAQALIAGMFDGFHFAQAHGDGQAGAAGYGGVRRASAQLLCLGEKISDHGFELFYAAHTAVPPTVISSTFMVGWPTPTGTLCPSLPQTPTP